MSLLTMGFKLKCDTDNTAAAATLSSTTTNKKWAQLYIFDSESIPDTQHHEWEELSQHL